MDKVTVTERALFARVDRKLAKEGQRLRRCKSDAKAFPELGAFYIVDTTTNTIATKNCELEALAKEVGVLADWEELEK